GLYLSPWDRNANCYSDPAAYDDFYLEQLAELCTGYGPLTELWFDGAGSQGRSYDWARIAELVSATQPDAMVFNMGRPTIRWVGNEDGLAEDPVQYVVASTKLDNYTTVTVDLAEEHWLPPECDVSLRRGWFFHPDDEPKSLEHLLGIHYRSIGLGAGLLLNLPPDTEGRIPDQDVARVREWRAELDRRFADPVPAEREVDGEAVRLRFARPIRLDHLELTEDIRAGQRILGHRVCLSDGTEVAAGQSVGVRRMHVLDPVTTDELVVWVSDADGRLVPEALSGATGFATGHSTPPVIPTAYRAPTVAPD
ncbi:MAG TPA: alpha-L-fucosidase, partial [Candidatus Avipropionibacterium avicola]|nr:alpha-L-fucosidase [Candidatus Avipropionibacterium avicola]